MQPGHGQEHHEFLTAEARQGVAVANNVGRTVTNLLQHLVAHYMTVEIIELFEVVDIEQDQGQFIIIASAIGKFLIRLFFKISPIV